MFEPIGPSRSATSLVGSLAMLNAMREAQATLRAEQKAKGHVGTQNGEADTARPVQGALAMDVVRRPPMYTVVEGVYTDPKLTGPRPTFDQTPLEEMRDTAFETDMVITSAPPPRDETGGGALPGIGTYGDIRGFSDPEDSGGALDIIT